MQKLCMVPVTVSLATATKLHWENSLPRQSILDRLQEIAREAVICSDNGIEAKDGAMPGTIRLREGTSQGVKDLLLISRWGFRRPKRG
jgi:hypothetical protein